MNKSPNNTQYNQQSCRYNGADAHKRLCGTEDNGKGKNTKRSAISKRNNKNVRDIEMAAGNIQSVPKILAPLDPNNLVASLNNSAAVCTLTHQILMT